MNMITSYRHIDLYNYVLKVHGNSLLFPFFTQTKVKRTTGVVMCERPEFSRIVVSGLVTSSSYTKTY